MLLKSRYRLQFPFLSSKNAPFEFNRGGYDSEVMAYSCMDLFIGFRYLSLQLAPTQSHLAVVQPYVKCSANLDDHTVSFYE